MKPRYEVDAALVNARGLKLGMVVRNGEKGAVRFATVEVPWSVITQEVREALMAQFNRQADRYLSDEPLW